MKCKERLERYLQERQVPYQEQHHPLAYTAQHVAESEHIPPQIMVKVVVVVADGDLVMLALPASVRVDLLTMREMLNVRHLRLASEEELAAIFTDCEIGTMPPFGNLYDIPVCIDESLLSAKTIYFQAGTHLDTMSIACDDFVRLVQPGIVPFARRPGELVERDW